MPNTSAAKKSLRKSKRQAIKNLKKKEALDTIYKKIERLAKTGEKANAVKLLPLAYKVFDKAVKVGLIKKNNAARHKARLARLVR